MKRLHLRSVLFIAAALPTCTPVATATGLRVQDAPPTVKDDNNSTAGQPGSDGWITSEVKARLLRIRDTPGMEIHVETRGGMVSLHGQVSSQADADRMVAAASSVKGVISVDDSGLVIGEPAN